MEKIYYDLTAPQKSIWLTEQYYKNTNINNLCGTFYSNEEIDFELLKQSLNIFLKNNDSFKIRLDYTNDKISQYFSEIDYIDFEVIDIKNDKDLENLENTVSSKIFNILNSLLFEAVLFRYPDGHGGFIFNSHHIVSDSWANGIVANDVGLIYSKLKNNENYSKSPELSYKSYINAEKEYINSPKFEKDKKYWDEVFSTVPEIATIPSVKETLKDDDLSANRLLLDIDSELLSKLNNYCTKYKISLYNLFMTVFALYLGRVSNLDDFVIGTPILNRTNYKEKQTTGMFINTLPLRINLSHNKTFIDNLKDIAINSMSLLRHQKYSFQYIIEDLRKKDSNLPKLYNVLYSYQVTKMNETTDCLEHTSSWIFNKTISDDLDIHMFEWDKDNSIKIAYDYKTSKYDEQDMKDIHARILHIINQILDDEKILLKDIEIVTPEEKHKILYEFNNTKMDYPSNKTIVDLFEEQVEKTPDNIAVVFEDQKLTYRELNEKANQLARYMQINGIKSNSIIGIMVNRSLEMIIGILSILKCGCAYLPLDSNYPKERINYILNDSNVSLVLLSNSTFSNINGNISKLNISLSESLYNIDNSNLNISYSSDSIMYVIYTSGSTGNPKGVMVSHKNLNNFLFGVKQNIDLSPNKTFLSVTTICFDIFALEVWGSLLNGLKLVVANEIEQNSAESINKLCIKNNVQIIQTTPSRFNDFLLDSDNIIFFKNLTDILIGGESLNKNLINKFKNMTSANIYNMYGPTETTVWSTIKKIDSIDTISIGFPIANTQCYILDRNLKLLPPNTPGTLYISGDGVSLGYLNKKDLTDSVFIKLSNNNKIYNTKDLCYYDKNGQLFHLGRSDFQIKLRGYRIELEEIENIVLSFAGITNSAIVPINTKYLVLYYSSKEDINIDSLKSFLSEHLPSYMVPSIYRKLDKFPYTPNGKIDRKKLSSIEVNSIIQEIKPRNDVDSYLLELLSNDLNTNKINLSDTFFAIGGDSLNAINISSKISSKYNIHISVRDILEYPIIKDLSDHISTLSEKKDNFTITKAKKMKYYPLSSAQKRVYYSSSLDNNSTLYNISGGIIVDSILDTNKLQECLNILVKRHESLRTHFDIIDNDVVQIIDDNVDFKLDLDVPSTDSLYQVYFDFVKPFNLSKAPLFRVKLVKLDVNKMLLLLDMHHIISDGTSLNILLQELCDLYNGSTLIEKQIDYKDFTLWEKEQFETEEFKKSKNFWINLFKDEIPLLNMPTISPRPSIQNFKGSNYHINLSKEIFNKIHQVAKDLNITPYMLMLSAYYILLSKYTSQDDIIVGTPIVGRELSELSNIIGMFVNTLALRNKIDNSLSFKEFSKNIKENCLNSFKNQSYPFDLLVKDLNIKREPSRNPLFDVMFIFQNNGYPKINFENIQAEYFIPYNNISKFDLSLEVIPIDNEYSLRFEYSTKLFDEDFIRRFCSHYINILNAIFENKEIKIADIDMLSKEEKYQILYEFNNTKVEYPSNKTVINLFEEQVEKTPNNIAVVFEDKKLTYKELNEESNQLARFLLANNINVGDTVGILLDKSLEMIISILGILKVGATFLPIDVDYPKERIDYIIRDSKTNTLLTTQSFIHKATDTVQPLCIDIESNQLMQYDNSNLHITYDVDNLAYIMYTSGSTGNPKGVMVSHKNINRLVKNNNFISFNKNENILQTGSIVFDACTFEIWGALLNGFKLFILKKEILLDSFLLENYLDKNEITTLWLTAPLFNQLCETNPYMFKNIDKLLTGGDVLSPKHINLARNANPNLTIINGYGPTENTTFSCCFTIDKKYTNSIPIGKPISNSTAYIVSASGLLCPIGVPGELWVGGDGVSKGYLNNETLTSDKFVNNPFGEGIIYKTGDLVKWLSDGNIEFIGRIDNQVKVRGFRIELNEINKRILEDCFVKESFTTVKTIRNVKYICSYIVVKRDFNLDALKNHLGKYLPSYMIPTYFIELKKLPINANGKVDKNSLPNDFKTFIDTRLIKEPSTNEEQLLLTLFRKILNNVNIGIDDNFFEVGGDSLTAMKLQVEAISNNLDISYSDIFKYPTVEDLANNLKSNNIISRNYISEYDKYDSLLKNNTLDKEIICTNTEIGNVLLTGFTGFLGAHILDSFIKKENGKIYCLIRSKNNMSARERLYNVLHFYFNTKYDDLVDNRIILIEGDITFDAFGLTKSEYDKLGNNINTVIHSAALVKHYGIYKNFEKINVIGTKNIVNFSQQFNTKLLHISTISVSGNNLAEGSNIDNHFEEEKTFDETNFYIGQNLENLYAKSKFEAEKIVLDAISNGLSACILRMGNLTSRFSEGKFQQNHFENAFVNRFKSFLQIGAFPKDLLNLYCEFTPIDYCGDAIINIGSHFNKNYTVFHLLNEKQVFLDRLFNMLSEIGIHINLISEKEFASHIEKILHDPDRRPYVEGIINDLTSEKKLVYKSDVNIKSDFTKEFLYKTGFEWPYIDINYIKNYFKYLIDIGYFNTTII